MQSGIVHSDGKLVQGGGWIGRDTHSRNFRASRLQIFFERQLKLLRNRINDFRVFAP